MEQNLYKEKEYELGLNDNELAELCDLFTAYSKHEENQIQIFYGEQIAKLKIIANKFQEKFLEAEKFKLDLEDKLRKCDIPVDYMFGRLQDGKYQLIIRLHVMLTLDQILTVLYYIKVFKEYNYNLEFKTTIRKWNVKRDIDNLIDRINECIENRVAPIIALE